MPSSKLRISIDIFRPSTIIINLHDPCQSIVTRFTIPICRSLEQEYYKEISIAGSVEPLLLLAYQPELLGQVTQGDFPAQGRGFAKPKDRGEVNYGQFAKNQSHKTSYRIADLHLPQK